MTITTTPAPNTTSAAAIITPTAKTGTTTATTPSKSLIINYLCIINQCLGWAWLRSEHFTIIVSFESLTPWLTIVSVSMDEEIEVRDIK